MDADRAILLDDDLRTRFATWSLVERHNTPRYVAELRAGLAWWASRLAGVDLRELSLVRHVLPELDQVARGRRPRAVALKILCSWLHGERHELEHNPLGALKVPQSRPEQWRRRKVVARQVLDATLDELEPKWRDAITVLCGTGWHVTELARFAGAGEISPRPRWARRDVAGVLETVHKGGELHRTAVSARVLAAARRIRARGELGIAGLRKALRRAQARAGVDRWGAGRLRHTVASWAVYAGEDLGDVAAFLGHRDARTTRRFYVELYTPRKVATLR